MIELKDVTKYYSSDTSVAMALRNINLEFHKGEFVVITGKSGSGKSTLLKALEQGIYNHVAGDGREYVITSDTAMKIRAEDGRCVSHINISPFINDLPNKKDTVNFSTEDASGSTSQAANVVEAVQSGAKCLLIDEDTSGMS